MLQTFYFVGMSNKITVNLKDRNTLEELVPRYKDNAVHETCFNRQTMYMSYMPYFKEGVLMRPQMQIKITDVRVNEMFQVFYSWMRKSLKIL